MASNSGIGTAKKESKFVRVLYALPLLGILCGCARTMRVSLSKLDPVFSEGGTKVDLGNGVVTSMSPRYFGIPGLDGFISMYAAFMTPALGGFDPVGRLQLMGFLADLVPLQVIWMVESARQGNVGTVAYSFHTVLSQLYQIQGIGFLAPIYYFIHYIQSPLENFATVEKRMTRISSVKTIIPTVAIIYILPTFGSFFAPGLTNRQRINGLFFQPFPIWAAIFQRILGLFVKDTTDTDSIKNPEADLAYLRAAYFFSAAASASVYLYLWVFSPFSLGKIFFSGLGNPEAALPLVEGAAKVLRYDHIASFSAGIVWTLLSFGDLKRAGLLEVGWGRIIGVFAGMTLVGGPGAAMAVMWAWREDMLADNAGVRGKEGKP